MKSLFFCMFLLGAQAAVSSEKFSDEQMALSLISKFASEICSENLAQRSSGQSLKFDGRAVAELEGLAKKLVDLGIEGALRIKDAETQGVLQADLAAAIENQSSCKKEIFYSLVDRLMPASANINPFVEDTEELLVPEPLSLVKPGQRFAMEQSDVRLIERTSLILTASKLYILNNSVPPRLTLAWTDMQSGETETAQVDAGRSANIAGCILTYYASNDEKTKVSLFLNCPRAQELSRK
jgi:hypothetical protein